MAKEKKTKELTDKQKRFAFEYCKDFDSTKAAKRSGYSEKGAGQIGYNLKQNPLIQKEIKKFQDKVSEAAGISKLGIALELKKIAFSSMASFNSEYMTLKDFSELSDDQKAALQEIRVTEKKYGDITETLIQLKLHDKLKAIDQIIKMFGFNEPEDINIGVDSSIPMIKWVSNGE